MCTSGFEVSGVVDELSPEICNKKPEFHEGDRIIVYPSDEKIVHSGLVIMSNELSCIDFGLLLEHDSSSPSKAQAL